jgi:hypothetical protein
VPIPGIEAGSETLHFFPDQLIVRTGRRYTPIAYADLKVDTKAMDVQETGAVMGKRWYNLFVSVDQPSGDTAPQIVRYSLIILAAGKYRVGLLVSGFQQAETFAWAIHRVAKRFAASSRVTARVAVPSVPVTTEPARQLPQQIETSGQQWDKYVGMSFKEGSEPKIPKARPVSVPDVMGLRQAAAETLITGAGLVLDAVTVQPSGTVATGNVISQSPAAGTLVNVRPGVSTAAHLVVSSGPMAVSVPDVVGMTQAAATAAIKGRGLVRRKRICLGTVNTQNTKTSGTVAAGSVISQSPAAGASVNIGSAVYLVVSGGPAGANAGSDVTESPVAEPSATAGPAKKATLPDAATAAPVDRAYAYPRPTLDRSRTHAAATEPVTVRPAEPSARGFALPPRRTIAKTPGVRLDAGLIEAKLKETAEVSALLAPVFHEDTAPTPAPSPSPGHGCIPGLDLAGSAFVRLLATRAAWSRGELESMANEIAILLDGTIESINDAAFACCDESALEGDDPVEVNISVLTTLAQRTVSA